MTFKNFSACIFDFDGTLVDSMPAWAGGILQILDDNGVSYPDNIVEIITPLGNAGSINYLIDTLGLKLSFDEVFAEMRKFFLPKYLYEISIKPGVKDFLEKLSAQGVSLNVLTASSHDTLDPCLKRVGIFDLFDNVWSCDDFDKTKTDPEIYNCAVSLLGVEKSKVAFFDDNIGAVKTAKKAGLYTVAVYDESSDGVKDEMKQIADTYIDSFEQQYI